LELKRDKSLECKISLPLVSKEGEVETVKDSGRLRGKGMRKDFLLRE
jgi:hypothetical protein